MFLFLKNIMFRIGFLSWVCFISLAIHGQDVPFDPSRFPGKESAIAHALKQLKQGDDYFYQENPLYKLALTYFEKAYQFNPDNSLLNFKIGVCHLHGVDKSKALLFLKRAYELNASCDADLLFYLGWAYHVRAQWDEAIQYYQAWLDAQAVEEKRKRGKKRIDECRNGKQLQAISLPVKIQNAGRSINSPYADYIPRITADESRMFFTSRRPGTTGGGTDLKDEEYFEDIYYSDQIHQQWQPAVNIEEPVNTKTHDAAAGISPDGLSLIVFKGDRNRGDLLISYFVNGQWTKPRDAGKNINTPFHESGACFSPDGKRLFFVSDKPGGYGGRDIYLSLWNDTLKTWGIARNLGKNINTEYDEEGPFLHADNKTLYFSSQGHNSIGGYDIFFSVFENNEWSKAENLGWPVNTPDDDIFFVLNAAGTKGYYASFRNDSYGGQDIYSIYFSEGIRHKPRLILLKGVVRHAITNEPLEATIDLLDVKSGQHIQQASSEKGSGRYLISLPAGREYTAVASLKGFIYESSSFSVPADQPFQEWSFDIMLKPVNTGYTMVLTELNFPSASAQLKTESIPVLDRLASLLRDYDMLKIEIIGHTDNRGNAIDNLELSRKRALSVFNYLVRSGIAPERMICTGMGHLKPLADNETEEGRSRNRRIEIKILTGKQ